MTDPTDIERAKDIAWVESQKSPVPETDFCDGAYIRGVRKWNARMDRIIALLKKGAPDDQ